MAELRKVDEEAYMYTFTVAAYDVVEEFDSITARVYMFYLATNRYMYLIR